MARVGEFCGSNVARWLLSAFIVVGLILAIGVWFFYSPGRGTSIEHQSQTVPQSH
jgi:hypothetical protein